MTSLFIRYIFILLCSCYTCSKITNFDYKHKSMYIITSLFTVGSSLLCSHLLASCDAITRITLIFGAIYLYILIFSKTVLTRALIITILSLGLSYVCLTIACVINSFIFYSLYNSPAAVPYEIADIFIGITQFLITYIIFYIKRLKNSFRTLVNSKNLTLVLYICITIIFYISMISTSPYSNIRLIRHIRNLTIIVFSLFLLYYWNHRITQTYREKLRLANEKSLEDELNNKLIEIETLKADNEHLAKIIHKDNKLVPAMHKTVIDFLESVDKLTPEELSRRGYELSEQLHKMAEDRQGILNEAHSKTNLPPTGIHTVDGVLSYMESRAVKENIAYKLHIDENIKPFILSSVSEEDLCHLLSDLIENAIIATRYSAENKQIKISLGVLKNHFILEVSDSGKEFDIETYQHFGQEKRTTHAEHGGSGIGLIDIWKIKKQNKISLQIYEYPSDSSAYSKKISFVFDRKNHFLMQTYRYKEIIGTLTRGDLYVFPYESTENI